MAQIAIPNGRLHSDIRAHVALKDNGVAVDWNGLSDIRARMYSVPQQAMAGEFSVAVNAEDGTDLICDYSAETPQYEGLARIVIRCVYEGRTKTYDAVLINLVPSTDNLADDPIVMDDPEVDVEIEVTEVSTSLLDEAIETAFDAAERAENAADLAEEKAEAADLAAGAAVLAAENADAKADLAARKAQEAEDAAALADAKARDAQTAAHNAGEKAAAAEGAAEQAGAAAQQARSAAGEATLAAGSATDAAAAAGAAAGEAQAATQAAQGATERANTAAGEASTQAGYAKDQGDYAKEQIDDAKGEFESIDARLDHNEEISIYLDETTDPTDEQYRDEYLRVLEVLYQAIVDARAASKTARDAAGTVSAARLEALTAAAQALQSANRADAAAGQALTSAEYARDEIDGAKGDFASLDARFDHNEEISLHLDETTDPTDEQYQDEYRRVLEVLYQAVVDAKAAAQNADKAALSVTSAKLDALSAASRALNAATSANEAADIARQSASAATAAMNAAKGSFPSLDARIKALETGKQDVIEDLGSIRSGASRGAVAVTFQENDDPSSLLD